MVRKRYTASYHESSRTDVQALIPAEARRILDVGCGAGQLGLSLKTTPAVEVTGIELDPKAAEIAKSRLDTVIHATVEEAKLPVPTGYFDVIIFADILEHLSDPWQVLKDYSNYLANEGCIVTSIPNISFYVVILNLLRGRWHYTDRGTMDKTHLRFFTLQTIEQMLTETGLKIEMVSRNYRLIDKDRRYRRLAKLLAKGPLRHLFTYQYLIRAKPINRKKGSPE